MEILRKKTEDVYPGLKVTSYSKAAADVYAYEWCDCGPPACHYGCDCGEWWTYPEGPQVFSANHESTWVSTYGADYSNQQG